MGRGNGASKMLKELEHCHAHLTCGTSFRVSSPSLSPFLHRFFSSFSICLLRPKWHQTHVHALRPTAPRSCARAAPPDWPRVARASRPMVICCCADSCRAPTCCVRARFCSNRSRRTVLLHRCRPLENRHQQAAQEIPTILPRHLRPPMHALLPRPLLQAPRVFKAGSASGKLRNLHPYRRQRIPLSGGEANVSPVGSHRPRMKSVPQRRLQPRP